MSARHCNVIKASLIAPPSYEFWEKWHAKARALARAIVNAGVLDFPLRQTPPLGLGETK